MAGSDTPSAAFLFHATFAEKLPSIAEEGLTPNFDRDPTFDGYPVSGRLYLATTLDGAEWYVEQLTGSYDPDDLVLLRVPADGVQLAPDPYGNPGDGFALHGIAPELVEIRREGEWVPLASELWPGPGARA